MNSQFIAIEPALEFQVIINNSNKLALAIGIVQGLPSFQTRWLFGDFRTKYWNTYWFANKTKKFEENYKIDEQSNGEYKVFKK